MEAISKIDTHAPTHSLAHSPTSTYILTPQGTKLEARPEAKFKVAKLPFMPPKLGQHAVQQRPHSYLEPQASKELSKYKQGINKYVRVPRAAGI